MIYRRLGRTNLQVSLLGVGGGYVMFHEVDDGTALYRRAAELGVNYFDGRYGHSSMMQAPVIKQDRAAFVIGSKTAVATREGVLQRVDEDLKELDSDYLDIYYLRAYNHSMVDQYFAPGGAVEGLLEARERGKIRFLGMAGHSDLTALARGVETGLIDVVQFPLNIARREALDILVPTLLKHDAGMVIMKPLNAGLAPAEIGLPWLANQPVHTMAAGMSDITHLELDAAVLDRDPLALTPAEEAEAERWREQTDGLTCRICVAACQPVCEPGIIIDWQLYHHQYQNELRRLGVEGFMQYPFAEWFKKDVERAFTSSLASLNSCTHCRKCEEVCPHHLPILDMFAGIKRQQAQVLDELRRAGWSASFERAESPLPARSQPTRRLSRPTGGA